MYGFHFKLLPPSFSHHSSFIARQQRWISRDTRYHAFVDGGNDGSRGKIVGRNNATAWGSMKDNGHAEIDQSVYFSRNNENPSQTEVNAHFRENLDPTPQEIANILQLTVYWKKKKRIDMLAGNNLFVVMSSVQRMLPMFNLPQLRNVTVGVLDSLQVISSRDDMEKSGSFQPYP